MRKPGKKIGPWKVDFNEGDWVENLKTPIMGSKIKVVVNFIYGYQNQEKNTKPMEKELAQSDLGKPVPFKTDEFSEKFQTAVDPPPYFWKIMLRIFSKIHDQSTPL